MADLIITVGKRKRWEISFAMLGFAFAYLFFTIMDLANSAQTGNKDADRAVVHIALICLTSYLLIYVLFHVRKLPHNGILTSLILLAVWIFITSIINNSPLWSLLVQMNMSVLWVLSYLFFYFYTARTNSIQHIQKFAKLLIVLYLGATIYYSISAFQQYGHFVAMNVVYYSLAILPWLLVGKKENERSSIWLLATATVLISLKRGAIIALPIMFMCEMMEKGGNADRSRKIIRLLKIGIIFVGAFLIADYLTGGYISNRFSKEEMEGGSGRIEYYILAIRAIGQRNLWRLLIGGGAGSSVSLLGTGVHNEWLEMLFSYGVIGLVLYIALIAYFIATTRRIYRTAPEYGPCCLMSLGLYLVLSMVSTGYGGYSGIFLFGFWGYIESLEKGRAQLHE